MKTVEAEKIKFFAIVCVYVMWSFCIKAESLQLDSSKKLKLNGLDSQYECRESHDPVNGLICTRSGDDSFLVATVKKQGPDDDVYKYEEKLAKKRFQRGLNSSVSFNQMVNAPMSKGPWVRSVHFESELPSYYTLYYATVFEGDAIVLSFSTQNKDDIPLVEQDLFTKILVE